MSIRFNSTAELRLHLDNFQRSFAVDPLGGLRCTHCDLPVIYGTLHLSIHVGTHCAGPGMVATRPLPFCRQCGGPAEEYGCLHITRAEAFKLRLRGVILDAS